MDEGRERSTTVPITGPQDLAGLIVDTLGKLRAGEITPTAANAIGYLVSHLLKVYEYGAKNAGESDTPVINIPQRMLPPSGKSGDQSE